MCPGGVPWGESVKGECVMGECFLAVKGVMCFGELLMRECVLGLCGVFRPDTLTDHRQIAERVGTGGRHSL